MNRAIVGASIHRLVTGFLKFLTALALARFLTTQEYGLYNLLVSVQATAFFVYGSGLAQAVSRYIPELLVTEAITVAHRITLYIFYLRFIGVAICSLAIWSFYPTLSRLVEIDHHFSHSAWLIVLLIALPRLIDVVGVYFRTASLEYGGLIAHEVIRFLAIVTLLAGSWWNGGSRILYLLLCLEFLSALFFLVWYLWSLTRQTRAADLQANGFDFKRVVKYSFHASLFSLGALGVNTSIDNIIVAKILGVEALATYALGLSLVMALHSLNPVIALKSVTLNFLTRNYAANKDLEVLFKYRSLIARFGLYTWVPTICILLLYGKIIIQSLYTERFVNSASLLPVFGLVCLFRISSMLSFGVISAIEKTRSLTIYNLFGALNVALAITMASHWGLLGVAAATAICELLWAIFLGHRVRQLGTKRSTGDVVNSLKILFNAGCASIIAAPSIAFSSTWTALVMSAFMFGLTYFFMSKINSGFTSLEKNLIREHCAAIGYII